MTRKTKAEYDREYRAKNRESIRESSRKYYAKNRERLLARNRERYAETRQKKLDEARRYYAECRDVICLKKRLKRAEKRVQRGKSEDISIEGGGSF